jgi:hypothetical protein
MASSPEQHMQTEFLPKNQPWNLRPGGYFILHDYFGWYDNERRNNSPVKKVIDELIDEGIFQHMLIDTGYQSFVVFRYFDITIENYSG